MIFVMLALAHGGLTAMSSAILFQIGFLALLLSHTDVWEPVTWAQFKLSIYIPPGGWKKATTVPLRGTKHRPNRLCVIALLFLARPGTANSLFLWAQCWLKHGLGNWTANLQSMEKSRMLCFSEHSHDYGSIVQRIQGNINQLLVRWLLTQSLMQWISCRWLWRIALGLVPIRVVFPFLRGSTQRCGCLL